MLWYIANCACERLLNILALRHQFLCQMVPVQVDCCHFFIAGGILLPTVAPAASTLSKQEQDRLAMPPPPAPQLSASPSTEGVDDSDSADKHSLAAPLASTIGSGK